MVRHEYSQIFEEKKTLKNEFVILTIFLLLMIWDDVSNIAKDYEFTNLRSERKSLNDRNENFVSINDKTWWQGCPPESDSMPNFFNSPQIARIKKTKMWPNSTGDSKTCHVLRFLRFDFYKLHDQSPIYAIVDFSYCMRLRFCMLTLLTKVVW